MVDPQSWWVPFAFRLKPARKGYQLKKSISRCGFDTQGIKTHSQVSPHFPLNHHPSEQWARKVMLTCKAPPKASKPTPFPVKHRSPSWNNPLRPSSRPILCARFWAEALHQAAAHRHLGALLGGAAPRQGAPQQRAELHVLLRAVGFLLAFSA